LLKTQSIQKTLRSVMNDQSLKVALQHCYHYEKSAVCEVIDEIVANLDFKNRFNGSVVLLKPNLISNLGSSLACTNKEFIAGVATWFLDHGAKVRIGDSPAFGSGISVCEQQGITRALHGMDIKQVDFNNSIKKTLAGGTTVNIAREALECDYFINLAKIKAHDQMYVTMAVKNIFGIIKGTNKAMLHMVHGGSHERFSGIILDLLNLLPSSLHLTDGITAMHVSGPLDGRPYQLNCVGGAKCPVALDTVLLEMLGLVNIKSPLWRVASKRNYKGCYIEKIYLPLLSPADFSGTGFIAPGNLHDIRFNPLRFLGGMMKRFLTTLRP